MAGYEIGPRWLKIMKTHNGVPLDLQMSNLPITKCRTKPTGGTMNAATDPNLNPNPNHTRAFAALHLNTVLARLAGPNAHARADQVDAVHAVLQPAARVLVVQATGWGKSAV